MSARTIGWIVAAVLAAAALGITWLFWAQNSARRVVLSLNLGVTKLVLAEPVPVPVLMGVCLGVGLLLGVLLIGTMWMRSGGRARRAREQAALGGDADKPW